MSSKKKAGYDDDSQFDNFMDETLSSEETSLTKHGGSSKHLMYDDDESSMNQYGLTGKGKSFMKSQKKESTLRTQQDELDDTTNYYNERNVPGLNLKSSYTITGDMQSSMTSTQNTIDDSKFDIRDGPETLKDKQNFFQSLEQDTLPNYGKLNNDFDKSQTIDGPSKMMPDPLSNSSADEEQFEHQQSDEKDREDKASMLSRVALMDSLDSTIGTRPGSQEVGNLDPIEEKGESRRSPEHFTTGQETDNTDRGIRCETDGHVVFKDEVDKVSHPLERELSDLTTKATLKTETGFAFTNTSGQLEEEYKQVLRQRDSFGTMGDAYDLLTTEQNDATLKGTTGDLGQATHGSFGTSGNLELGSYNASASELHIARVPVPTPRSSRKESSPTRKKDKYAHITSSGYGKASPSKSKLIDKATIWSPAETMKAKIRGSDRTPRIHSSKKSQIGDGELLRSIQSFADYVQHHHSTPQKQMIDNDHKVLHSTPAPQISDGANVRDDSGLNEREKILVGEVKEWQERWKDERRMHAKITARLSNVENDCDMKLTDQRDKHTRELERLKKENFVLSCKIVDQSSVDAESHGKKADGASSEDQLKQLKKEVIELEQLVKGYQQENERLYQELKNIQKLSKISEKHLFEENQQLRTQLTNLREEVDKKKLEVHNLRISAASMLQSEPNEKSEISPTIGGPITILQSRLKVSQERESTLQKDLTFVKNTNSSLESEKQKLDLQVQRLQAIVDSHEKAKQLKSTEQFEVGRKRVDPLGKSTSINTDVTSDSKQVSVLVEQVATMKQKLKWYAENQSMLDKDVEIIRAKDGQIGMLEKRIAQLQNVSVQKSQKQRSKDRSADARRIQDLERQVKEMEGVLRKRHPNSLPVLMWAASNAQSPQKPSSQPQASISFLEERIKKLEMELETKDEEGKRTVRALQQKHTTVKIQYDDRIEQLEERLQQLRTKSKQESEEISSQSDYKKTIGQRGQIDTERILTLQKELHQLEIRLQQNELTRQSAAHTVEAAKISESNLRQQMNDLQRKLDEQNAENMKLVATVDILNKEKDVLYKKINTTQGKTTQGKITAGRSRSLNRKEELKLQVAPPPTIKPYEPEKFQGDHITEIVQQNDKLRKKLNDLELDQTHERVRMQKILAETEGRERQSMDQLHQKIQYERDHHLREINRMKNNVKELESATHTQKTTIEHLQREVESVISLREQLTIANVKESTLENNIRQLLDELNEAKATQKPEMRHFETLSRRLGELQDRQSEREKELKLFQHKQHMGLLPVSSSNTSSPRVHSTHHEETAMLRKQIDDKNTQIQHFRCELDSLLEMLKVLQKQGVILPTKKT